ncbi:hypothetical protein [Flagellimonas marinaquae]|uniref:hypothetical protein n=1 Tax=Flagellimonas marinaquae TaxID=254955 RepID=UPI0020753111|nr:hypothetical protein [Allomuricauda aquimarina]USD25874.1 hypothetical protein MJO53_03020 [Allomuricauda aquimarina]
MTKNKFNTYIAYLFIAAYLSLKVVSFHVFVHEDDNVLECQVCEFIAVANSAPQINGTSEYNVQTYFTHSTFVVEKNYDFVSKKSLKKEKLFSRPPPHFL